MENLPTELLERIFLLACTDGGRTGRSLALTSKHVHAASRTACFHTVALVSGSPSQVVQFVASFTAECAQSKEAKPRVRHLCLASAQQQAFPSILESGRQERLVRVRVTPDDAHSTAEPDSILPSGDEDSTRKEQLTTFQKQTQRYYRDMMVLLQLLAADLHTLCILDPDWPGKGFLNLPAVPCTGFPALVELAIVGKEPVLRRATGSTDTDASQAFFPVLRTLHRVTLPRSPLIRRASNPTVEQWKARAPHLKGVQVCHLSGAYGVSIAELCDRLGRERKIQMSSTMAELVGGVDADSRRRLIDKSGCLGKCIEL
ncbi:hypothetical protein C8Q79DRAFT_407882 [Trametes meyenii]|nr:hypothetical protein C8Q79DRAFT_407882 [Trametes meyenii]